MRSRGGICRTASSVAVALAEFTGFALLTRVLPVSTVGRVTGQYHNDRPESPVFSRAWVWPPRSSRDDEALSPFLASALVGAHRGRRDRETGPRGCEAGELLRARACCRARPRFARELCALRSPPIRRRAPDLRDLSRYDAPLSGTRI